MSSFSSSLPVSAFVSVFCSSVTLHICLSISHFGSRLGSVGDFELTLRTKHIDDDIMVVSCFQNIRCACVAHACTHPSCNDVNWLIGSWHKAQCYNGTLMCREKKTLHDQEHLSAIFLLLLQVAGDMLFNYNFNILQIINFFRSKVCEFLAIPRPSVGCSGCTELVWSPLAKRVSLFSGCLSGSPGWRFGD